MAGRLSRRDLNKDRSTLIFAAAIGIAVLSHALAISQELPKALVRHSSWDFGYLPQKSEATHLFYLQNTGSAPLSIEEIKPGCACTSVSEIEDAIAPGDSVAIAVTFKSGRYRHRVKKVTKVYTDDPETPVQRLQIAANVVKDEDETGAVSVRPRKLELEMDRESADPAVDTIMVLNSGSDSMTVVVMHSSDGIVDRVEAPEFVAPGCSSVILVHLSRELEIDRDSGPSVTLGLIGSDTTIVTVPIEIED